ncbi:MAG: GxxExxY protein [Planctomycetia bacterium]|nr:GxxExxY protein [Planctomycetia bacterium]
MRHTDALHSDLTRRIIGFAFRVHNRLGPGLPEVVYGNALAIELRKAGIPFRREVPLEVCYEGESVGTFAADFVCVDGVILELKAVQQLTPPHEAQLLTYLVAGRMPVGLLLNFGGLKVEVVRKVRSEFGARAG